MLGTGLVGNLMRNNFGLKSIFKKKIDNYSACKMKFVLLTKNQF